MSWLADAVAEAKEDVKNARSLLSDVRVEALEDDGIIDAEEASEIEDLEEELQLLEADLSMLEAQLAAEQAMVATGAGAEQEDDDGGGGFFSDLIDSVSDAVEDVVDQVTETVGQVASAVSDTVDNAQDDGTDNPEETSDTPGSTIADSVGEGGANENADVLTVQSLLNRAGENLAEDGLIGPKTKGAIGNFQKGAGLAETKRIDPGDDTWSALRGGGGGIMDTIEDAIEDVTDVVEDFVEESGLEEWFEAFIEDIDTVLDEADELLRRLG